MDSFSDYEDAFSAFKQMALMKNSTEDQNKLRTIVDEIVKYDVFDFIARLSALNLLIENQNKNVARIAELGGSLYDKLFNFTEDMQRIDKSLDAARKNYDQAIKKLSTGKGNALSLAAQLKQRGAKTGKTIELEYDEENEIKELTDINEVVNEEN